MLIAGCIHTDSTICEFDEVQGGGCPDLNECGNTCKRCFTGAGNVIGACLSKGSGQIEDYCRCYFIDGAPCIPGCATHPPSFPHYDNNVSASSVTHHSPPNWPHKLRVES